MLTSSIFNPILLCMVDVSLLIGASIYGVGVIFGLIFQWGLHRRTLRLEYRQADLEQEVLSEKRKRAVNTRWSGGGTDKEVLAQLLAQQQKPNRYVNDVE